MRECEHMRRNFAQVLKAGKVDLKKEYSKLYALFYGRDDRDDKSLADLISMNIESFYFRGTCLDLDEFDEKYGFHFAEQPQDFDIDYLVSFCEYIYNFVLWFEDRYFFAQINKHFYLQQISKVIEAIGYMESNEDGFTIFVPKDNAAIAVSESEHIPEILSYRVIAYNHHSMKGNLEAKKAVLQQLASILEAKRKDLSRADKTLESDLFYAFNNLNIRHNNVDPGLKGKYKAYVAQMSTDELEKWYNETYQMCLLAFLQIENLDRKAEFDKLKAEIEKSSTKTALDGEGHEF